LRRGAGQKEARLAHLLGGAPQPGVELRAPDLSGLAAPTAPGALERLEQRLAALEARVLELEQQLGLGLPPDPDRRPEQG
jgi:uncharacterized protein YceH (UPF0502 family)